MDGVLRLQLAEEGADAERLNALTGFLRQETLQLDVNGVTGLPAGEPPPSARGLDAATVGGLLNSDTYGHFGRGPLPRLPASVSLSAAIYCVRASLVTDNAAGSAFAPHRPTLRPTYCVEIRANDLTRENIRSSRENR